MTDRELLELAAKAAGIEIRWGRCAAHVDDYEYTGVTGPWVNNLGWNPLTDDGDAFRLMVGLRLGTVFPTEIGRDRVYVKGLTETLHDPLAATRRAIVRAAAEIGRTL